MTLTHRIVFLLLLALLPLAALQLVSMHELRQERIAQAESAAMARAMTIAEQQNAVISSAFSVIRAIAALPSVADAEADSGGCARILQAIVAEREGYNSAAVTDAEGRVVCASANAEGGTVDFGDRAWFQELRAAPDRRVIGEQVESRLNGARIVPLALARSAGGEFKGAVSIGLDAAYLQHLLDAMFLNSEATAGLADRHGRIIATLPFNADYIGRSLIDLLPELRTAKAPGTVYVNGASGRQWLIAFYPAAAEPLRDMYLTVGFNMTALTAPIDEARNTNLAAMAVFLVLSVGTVAVGARFFVGRPIEKLRRVAVSWKNHDFAPRMQISRSNIDLAPLGESLNDMADELAASLEQKDLLLREINHRVMNSMQIISSLLVMQSRRIANKSLAAPLMSAVERINALGTVHRRLHLSASIDTIDLGTFIRDLVVDVGRALGGENTSFTTDIQASPLVTVDDAVALGLILNEVLTNAIKHAQKPDEGNHVIVRLMDAADGEMILSVQDHGHGSIDSKIADSSSLGMVVIQSLARQMKASITFETTAQGVLVSLRWNPARAVSRAAEAA